MPYHKQTLCRTILFKVVNVVYSFVKLVFSFEKILETPHVKDTIKKIVEKLL